MAGNKHRIFYIDLLRVIAIIGIIYSHVAVQFLDRHTVLLQNMFVGSAALFFMTSGALIFPIRRPGPFLTRRLCSYVPEWIIFSVLYATLLYNADPNTYMLTKHLTWMAVVPTFPEAWFLYTLTGLYLVAPMVSVWLEHTSRRQIEWFLAAWLASGFVPMIGVHAPIDISQSYFAPFFGYLGYMVAGHYLHRWPLRQRSKRFRIAFLAATALLGIAYALRAFVTAWRWDFATIMSSDLSVNVMAICLLYFAAAQLLTGYSTHNEHVATTVGKPSAIHTVITLVSTATLGIYLCQPGMLQFVVQPLGWTLWPTVGAVLVLSAAAGIVLHQLRRRIRF